jgi:hypothetical protein
VGTVLIFFAYFFVQDKKVSGVWGKAPLLKYLKIKNINVLTIFLSCTKRKFKIIYRTYYREKGQSTVHLLKKCFSLAQFHWHNL